MHTPLSEEIFSHPLTYERLDTYTRRLAEAYPFLRVSTLAYSLCGKRIPYLMVGEGHRTILYVGAHHSMEWLTSCVLLAFCNELCRALSAPEPNQSNLRGRFRFVIIPELNPDGVELVLRGVQEGHVLAGRQIRMNRESPDFSHWQANARGVDLNHNYSVGFYEYQKIQAKLGITSGAPSLYAGEYPESEPEVAALAGLVRLLRPAMILTLHTQGEEIYFDSPHATPSMHKMAEAFAHHTGYCLETATGTAAYGGLTEWAVRCGIPCFTFECGKGKNPLPQKDGPTIYETMRSALFAAPELSLL